MKNILKYVLFLAFSLGTCLVGSAVKAMDGQVEEENTQFKKKNYKIIEYNDIGRIIITFKHTPKGQDRQKKYMLISLDKDDIPQLVNIRRLPEVFLQYPNYDCPTIRDAKSLLENRLLSRVDQQLSFFPFVLKEVIKSSRAYPPYQFKIIGFFNIGNGLAKGERNRTHGYYMDPQEHGKGIGSVAVNVCTHFIMQFHENASHSLKITLRKGLSREINIQRPSFNGVLSATCLPENGRSFAPLTKAGLKELSDTEIAERGYTDYFTAYKNGEEVREKYLELTWEQFKENEESGLYDRK